MIILFYKESEIPYGCFSNFSPHTVEFKGIVYKTSEHAFQAHKTLDPVGIECITNAPTPTLAKKLARRVLLRENWEQIKDDVMYHIVKAKFTQHADIRKILLDTLDSELREHTSRDHYWADGGDGTGRNQLGITLMRVRNELRAEILPEALQLQKLGQIRVGRRKYYGRGFQEPYYPNFIPIIVMIGDGTLSQPEYGRLSPYNIRTPPTSTYQNGVIHENYWQFSKVYQQVPPINQSFSKKDLRIVWSDPGSQHLDDNGKLTHQWYDWHTRGFRNNEAVRFPVGEKLRHHCLFSVQDDLNGHVDDKRLSYVDARKVLYCKMYCSCVRIHPTFAELQDQLRQGKNLLIIEVDGPHQESLPYYMENYHVSDTFIQNGTVVVDVPNMKLLMNDEKHAFGHGYCLAMELLGIREQVCQ